MRKVLPVPAHLDVAPCPWCYDGVAKLVQLDEENLVMECDDCGMRGPWSVVPDVAVKWWNDLPRREDPPEGVK